MKVSDPQSMPPEHWRPGVETRMVTAVANGAAQLCIFGQWVEPGVGAPAHSHPVEEVLTVREAGGNVDRRRRAIVTARQSLHRAVLGARLPQFRHWGASPPRRAGLAGVRGHDGRGDGSDKALGGGGLKRIVRSIPVILRRALACLRAGAEPYFNTVPKERLNGVNNKDRHHPQPVCGLRGERPQGRQIRLHGRLPSPALMTTKSTRRLFRALLAYHRLVERQDINPSHGQRSGGGLCDDTGASPGMEEFPQHRVLRLEGDRIKRIDVYFGATLSETAPSSKAQP
jgi:hypothetical protein